VDADPEQAGGVEVLVHVRLEPTTPPELFAAYLHTERTVLHAWHTAGDIDFEVHLRCQGLADLHDLLTRARCVGGARATTTHLILHRLPSAAGRAAPDRRAPSKPEEHP
jgi:hypothetical protein